MIKGGPTFYDHRETIRDQLWGIAEQLHIRNLGEEVRQTYLEWKFAIAFDAMKQAARMAGVDLQKLNYSELGLDNLPDTRKPIAPKFLGENGGHDEIAHWKRSYKR
jgi:hypothetical protein